MRTRSFLLGPLGAALLTAACAVGPNYKRPDVAVPPAYKGAPTAAPVSPPPSTSDWKPASPADAENRGAWWRVFGDPQLDALEDRVSVSNQSLALAEAQFRNARAVARGAKAQLFPTLGVTPLVTRSHAPAARSTALPGAPVGTATTYQLQGEVFLGNRPVGTDPPQRRVEGRNGAGDRRGSRDRAAVAPRRARSRLLRAPGRR
jgi:outer membrane protein TolC